MAHTDWKTDDLKTCIVERIDDTHAIAHVGAFDLAFSREQESGWWIEAEDLGRWLGYERPRDARKLASRLRIEGFLNDSEFCATVAQTTGGLGRPAREAWLSRKGALKVAARSDTPRAKELLDAIVTVFEAVIESRVSKTHDPVASALEMVLHQFTLVTARLEALEARDATRAAAFEGAQLLSSSFRRRLLAGLRDKCATTMHRIQPAISLARHRASVEIQLRAASGVGNGPGSALETFSLDQWEAAMRSRRVFAARQSCTGASLHAPLRS